MAARLWGALRLDLRAYTAAADDPRFTPLAAGLVLLVVLLQVGGGLAVRALVGSDLDLAWLALGPLTVVASWLVGSGAATAVGISAGGTGSFGRVLRAMALAEAPGVFYGLVFLPWAGWAVLALVWVWTVACVYCAVRAALRLGPGTSLVTTLAVVLATEFALFILAGIVQNLALALGTGPA